MNNKIKKYQKTLALIDAANIIYSNRNLKWAIDHKKLLRYLLVDYLKAKDKKTIVFSSIQSCGKKLRKTAHAFIEINQLRQILEFVTK